MKTALIIATVLAGWSSGTAFGQCEVTELNKLIAPGGAAGDYSGYAVAVSGGRAAVGAYRDDYGGFTDSGSVAIYEYVSSVWSYIDRMIPDAPGHNLWYGSAVALDIDLLAVGAPGIDGGVVFVYRHDGSHWNHEGTLTASDSASGDAFGCALSVNQGRILVGAYGDDDWGSESGSAYLFEHDGTAWVQTAKIKAGTGLAQDHFGTRVSLNRNLMLIASMYKMDYRGVCYVFRDDGIAWRQEQILMALDGEAGHYFGAALGVLNAAAGVDIAVVGAPHEDSLGDDAGAAYVFRFVGGHWTQDQKLRLSDGATYDYFGWSVAMADEFLAVGSISHDHHGSVSLYADDGMRYAANQRLVPSDSPAGSHFGHAVAMTRNFVFVGAAYDSPSGAQSGSAYTYAARLDLTLKPSLTTAHAGDVLAFTTSFGYPDDLVGLVLVDIGGTALFNVIAHGTFAFPSFKWTLSGVVPGGLAGIDATFQSFGYDMCGRVDGSNRVLVAFR